MEPQVGARGARGAASAKVGARGAAMEPQGHPKRPKVTKGQQHVSEGWRNVGQGWCNGPPRSQKVAPGHLKWHVAIYQNHPWALRMILVYANMPFEASWCPKLRKSSKRSKSKPSPPFRRRKPAIRGIHRQLYEFDTLAFSMTLCAKLCAETAKVGAMGAAMEPQGHPKCTKVTKGRQHVSEGWRNVGQGGVQWTPKVTKSRTRTPQMACCHIPKSFQRRQSSL